MPIIIVNKPPVMRAGELKRALSKYVQFERFYAKPVDKSDQNPKKFIEAYLLVSDQDEARQFQEKYNAMPFKDHAGYFWNIKLTNAHWSSVFQFQEDIREQKEEIMQFQLQDQQQKHLQFLDWYEKQYKINGGRQEDLGPQRKVINPNVGVCTFLDLLL